MRPQLLEVTVNNDGREIKRLTKRSPLIIGKAEVGDMTEEEIERRYWFCEA